MSSFADSEPVFTDRAKAAGLSEDVIKLVHDAGFKSLSKFAFSSSYIPGSGDDSAFVKTLRAVLNREATLGELASFRKLLHESYSLVTAEMKQQLEPVREGVSCLRPSQVWKASPSLWYCVPSSRSQTL